MFAAILIIVSVLFFILFVLAIITGSWLAKFSY